MTVSDWETASASAIWLALRPAYLRELRTFKKNLPLAERLPATGVLLRAYVERLESFISANDDGPSAVDSLPDSLSEEILELRGWLRPEQPPADPQVGRILMTVRLMRAGLPAQKAIAVVGDAMLSKKRGPAMQGILLTAYEMKAIGKTYRQITKELCECGKAQHDIHCQDAMRKGIERVKKLVKKYS